MSTSESSRQVYYYVATDPASTFPETPEIPVASNVDTASATFPLAATTLTYTVSLAPEQSSYNIDGTPIGMLAPRFAALDVGPAALLEIATLDSPNDIDGDAKSDIAIWRPDSGVWFILPSKSPGSFTSTAWGLGTDIPVPGDYDGDGKTDIAVWRPSNGVWYILPSKVPGTYRVMQWGMTSDVAISSLTRIIGMISR